MNAQDFLAGVGVKIIADERVQAAAKQLAVDLLASEPAQQAIDKQADKMIAKFMSLLPLAAAAAGESVAKQIAKVMPDIDIPGVSNVYDLTEDIRNRINAATPPGITIPGLNELGHLFGLGL